MIIGSRQKIRVIDGEMNIKINDNKINRVDFVKSLGLHIDEHLSWSVHIRKLCKKIASAIGALKRIRPFITTNTAIQVYQSLIQPHFDYCCSVWDGLGETLITRRPLGFSLGLADRASSGKYMQKSCKSR